MSRTKHFLSREEENNGRRNENIHEDRNARTREKDERTEEKLQDMV